MKRGEVYWAMLAPRSGSEQQGRRPVIVVSHDGFNQTPTWRSVIVVPVSTSPKQAGRGPTVVPLPKSTGGLKEGKRGAMPSGDYVGSRETGPADRDACSRRDAGIGSEAKGSA